MGYANLIFLYGFLPLCLILYYFFNSIFIRNLILILFSLIFYAWGEPLWILILLFSAVFNWFLGVNAHRFRMESLGRILMIFAVAVDILLLVVFKYTGVVNPFPLGISIYTLQAISYVIDCYRDRIEPQDRFYLFLLYFCMFPRIMGGPVERYRDMESRLESRTISASDIYEGILRLVTGLTKIIVFAGHLLPIADTFFDSSFSGLSVLGAWYALLCFTLYLYFELSGFSDIAIGLSRLFGFHLKENFDHPYMCRTITEFWQRWYVSLGTFFGDYLFPSVARRFHKSLALCLVWVLMGLWHTAAWNGLLWGLFHGLFLLLEQLLGEERIRRIPVWIKHIYTKLVILIGFGILYFDDMRKLGGFFRNLFGISLFTGSAGLTDPAALQSLTGSLILLIPAIILCAPVRKRITEPFLNSKNDAVYKRTLILQMAGCILLLAVCTLFLADGSAGSLLYWKL
ncbi:MAG: MBOAT family protein [Parasporobacterium sp.]|nr:MBOAT family protein [Parasporobacterium sp.]